MKHKSNELQKNDNKRKNFSIKKTKNADKLSFKFKFELDNIPIEINKIQDEISSIKNELKDNNLYINNPNRFADITKDLETLEINLELKEVRWLELLEMEENIKNVNEQ